MEEHYAVDEVVKKFFAKLVHVDRRNAGNGHENASDANGNGVATTGFVENRSHTKETEVGDKDRKNIEKQAALPESSSDSNIFKQAANLNQRRNSLRGKRNSLTNLHADVASALINNDELNGNNAAGDEDGRREVKTLDVLI